MKSAYELAMERLSEGDDAAKKPLSDDQKKELAAIDEKFKAKIAEREIFLSEKLNAALSQGKITDAEDIRKQLANEKARFEEDCEFEKEKIRKQ